MKNKLLSLLLAGTMVLSLAPPPARAAGDIELQAGSHKTRREAGDGPAFYIDPAKTYVVDGVPTLTINIQRSGQSEKDEDIHDWVNGLPNLISNQNETGKVGGDMYAVLCSVDDLLTVSTMLPLELGTLPSDIYEDWAETSGGEYLGLEQTQTLIAKHLAGITGDKLAKSVPLDYSNATFNSTLWSTATTATMNGYFPYSNDSKDTLADGVAFADPVAFAHVYATFPENEPGAGVGIQFTEWEFYTGAGRDMLYSEFFGDAGVASTNAGTKIAALGDAEGKLPTENYALVTFFGNAPLENTSVDLLTLEGRTSTGKYAFVPAEDKATEWSIKSAYTYTNAKGGALAADPITLVESGAKTPLAAADYTLTYHDTVTNQDLDAAPTDVGSYTVTASVTGAGYTAPEVLTQSFTIVQAMPEVETLPTLAESAAAALGGQPPKATGGVWSWSNTPKAVDAVGKAEVPGTWSLVWDWGSAEDHTPGDLFGRGDNWAGLTFTPNDGKNYRTLTVAQGIDFQVAKSAELLEQGFTLKDPADGNVTILAPDTKATVTFEWYRKNTAGDFVKANYDPLTVAVKTGSGILDLTDGPLTANYDPESGQYVLPIKVQANVANNATATLALASTASQTYAAAAEKSITVTVKQKQTTAITIKETENLTYNSDRTQLQSTYSPNMPAIELAAVQADSSDVTETFTRALEQNDNAYKLMFAPKSASGYGSESASAPTAVGEYGIRLSINDTELLKSYQAQSDWVPYIITNASTDKDLNLVVDAPDAGKTPAQIKDIGGLPSTADYTITAAAWTKTGTTDPVVKSFDPVTRYTLTLTIKAGAGYLFPADLSATINTKAAKVTLSKDKTTATVVYDFDPTGKSVLAVKPDGDVNTGIEGITVTVDSVEDGRLVGFYAEGQPNKDADGTGSLAQFYLNKGYVYEYRPVKVGGKNQADLPWRQMLLPEAAYTDPASEVLRRLTGPDATMWPETAKAGAEGSYTYTMGEKAIPDGLTDAQKAMYGALTAVTGQDGAIRYMVTGLTSGDTYEVRFAEGATYSASEPLSVTIGGAATGGSGGVDLDETAAVVFYDWDDTLLGSIVVPKGEDVSQNVAEYQNSLISDQSKDKDNGAASYFVDDATKPLSNKRGYSFLTWLPYESELPTHCGRAVNGDNAIITLPDPTSEEEQDFTSLDGNVIVKACYKDNSELYYNEDEPYKNTYTIETTKYNQLTAQIYSIDLRWSREKVVDGKTVGVPRMVEPQLRVIYNGNIYNFFASGNSDVETFTVYPAGGLTEVSSTVVDFYQIAGAASTAGDKAAPLTEIGGKGTDPNTFLNKGVVGSVNDKLAANDLKTLVSGYLKNMVGLNVGSYTAPQLQTALRGAWLTQNSIDGTENTVLPKAQWKDLTFQQMQAAIDAIGG